MYPLMGSAHSNHLSTFSLPFIFKIFNTWNWSLYMVWEVRKIFLFSYIDKEFAQHNSYSQFFLPLVCCASAVLKKVWACFWTLLLRWSICLDSVNNNIINLNFIKNEYLVLHVLQPCPSSAGIFWIFLPCFSYTF